METFCKLNGAINSNRNETRIVSSSVNHYLSISDAILSIPGITFVNKEYDVFKNIIRSLVARLDNGILPAFYDQLKAKENAFRADLSLWLIEIIYQYFKLTDDLKFIEDELFTLLQDIVNSYKKNKKYSIGTDSGNLLLTGSPSQDSNWIKLRDDNGLVIRYGKLSEMNALWYNAVMIMEQFSLRLGKNRDASRYAKYAAKLKENFIKEFYMEDGNYLYDFINEKEKNRSVRINQLLPLSLSFSPLTKEQSLMILNRIDKELLTPYGLRTLSKSDEMYISGKGRSVFSKSPAYYNGAVLPFAIGLYVQAYCKLREEENYADLWEYFKPLMDVKSSGILGYFPDFLIEDSENICCQYGDFTLSSANLIWSYYLLFGQEKQMDD
jgi:predicted glycogen debranching enzyme